MAVTKQLIYISATGRKTYEVYCLSCGKVAARVYNPFFHAWNRFVLKLHVRAGCS